MQYQDPETGRWEPLEVAQRREAADVARKAERARRYAEAEQAAVRGAQAASERDALVQAQADRLPAEVRAACARVPSEAGRYGVDAPLAHWLHARMQDAAQAQIDRRSAEHDKALRAARGGR